MNIKEINEDFDREYDKYKNSPEYKAFAKQEPVNTMPTKIVGPNLEQTLNAAGFYRQREWVGLTDEEKQAAYLKIDTWSACVDFIEAKLKEKNT